MSWDDYWRGPLSAFFIFSNAHKRKMQSEIDLLDYQAWRCGLYTRAAITSTYKMLNPLVKESSRDYPYPQECYSIQEQKEREKTEKEKQEELRRQQQSYYDRLSAWAAAFKGKGADN
ncbi:MAG: hypothetical protein E6R03_07075 [Hyphomicrobiaceae bacterium]|nr:MAG: hypothetical protein E6R03_07075 [Hyphomicrobiaceae bacterium]